VSSANRRGILALVAGMAAFSVNDVMMKFVTLRFPIGEVMFIRGIMTVALMGAAVIALGYVRQVRFALTGRIILRSIFEATAVVCFVVALVHMKLADLSAVFLVAPLLLTALSVWFYQEIVGWRRWVAIAVGFAGTLFIVKPTPAAFDVWALFGLAAALGSALRDLVTRRIDPHVPTIIIALMALIAVTLMGLLMGFFEEWRPMPASDVLCLAVAAIFVGIAFCLMVIAFRGADTGVVAPFRYAFLLWAMLAGYLAFGEVPDRWAFVGGALVVGSGLYALRREAVRQHAKEG
jgi:drug/metabolite transporter (DMT)-like permease